MSLAAAASFFHDGDMEKCLEGLIGSSAHKAAVLGTRCYIRAGRISEAEATIEAYWRAVRDSATDAERGETAMLRGAVAAKLGKRITALSAFCEARGYLFGLESSNNAVAELENHQAVFAVNEGDLDSASHCAEIALECGGLRERVAARGILALVHGAKHEFRAQIDLFDENLKELAGSEDNNFLLASTLQNLSILAQQQDRFDLYERIRVEAERLPWITATRKFESTVYRELGLLAARFGDHLAAFRFLRRAAQVAPAIEQQLEAILDNATVAREINEVVGSADRVANAEELASKLDWSKMTMQQRVMFFTLAEEQARLDPAAARLTLDTVLKLNRRESINTGPSADQRFQAVAIHAIGIVSKSEGNRGLAASSLQQAFTYWTSIGFGWTAATTALELLELTGDAQYRRYIEDYLRRTPSVHLRRQYERAVERIAVLAS